MKSNVGWPELAAFLPAQARKAGAQIYKKGILKDEYNIFDRARSVRPADGLLSDHLPAVVFVQARAHHLSLH